MFLHCFVMWLQMLFNDKMSVVRYFGITTIVANCYLFQGWIKQLAFDTAECTTCATVAMYCIPYTYYTQISLHRFIRYTYFS